MMKYFLVFLLLVLTSSAFAQVMWTTINQVPERRASLKEGLLKLKGDFQFNYFTKYLGPSLSPDMKQGSTFNRFKTGQDAQGYDQDFRGSHQTFHSFKLGYNLTNNLNLNFTHTYQYDENNGVEYNYMGWDGKEHSSTRQGGDSYNNQRVNLLVKNIINNKTLYLNTNIYYEIPSTEASQENDMNFGYGIAPSLGFYSNVSGLSYGLNAMIERDVYPDNEFYPEWCKQDGYTCNGIITNKRQVMRVGFGPWLNYMINDDYTFRTSLNFDYDLDGDQIKPLENGNLADTKFNQNMDDIASFSLSYRLNNNMSLSGGLEASITRLELDRTALFGTFNLSI